MILLRTPIYTHFCYEHDFIMQKGKMKKTLFWTLYTPMWIFVAMMAWAMYPLCLIFGVDKIARLHNNVFMYPAQKFEDWVHDTDCACYWDKY